MLAWRVKTRRCNAEIRVCCGRGIAQVTLPQSVVAWEYLVEDYDRIRNDIEAVLPEFADYNQRIRHPGGFHLINAAAERRWMTPSGKANFITCKGLLEDPLQRLTVSWSWRQYAATISTTRRFMVWMIAIEGIRSTRCGLYEC